MESDFIRRFWIIIIFSAIIGIGPVYAFAQDDQSDADTSAFHQRFEEESMPRPPHGGPGGKDLLADFDADNDGQLSQEEFPGPADHFNILDTDGDGYLSADELRQGRPGPPRNHGFERDDTDQDGRVSLEEFSGSEDIFDQLDIDGDGYISQEEIRQGHPRPPHGMPPETNLKQE